MKDLPVLVKEKVNCCGCSACANICKTGAVTMVEDKEGFLYPQVSDELCVRCYMCLKVCPIEK